MSTIVGKDYKCIKSYKQGNCSYTKGKIYHCNRDGYLYDDNGVSWSCTEEWCGEYLSSKSPLETFPRVNEFDCGSSYRH